MKTAPATITYGLLPPGWKIEPPASLINRYLHDIRLCRVCQQEYARRGVRHGRRKNRASRGAPRGRPLFLIVGRARRGTARRAPTLMPQGLETFQYTESPPDVGESHRIFLFFQILRSPRRKIPAFAGIYPYYKRLYRYAVPLSLCAFSNSRPLAFIGGFFYPRMHANELLQEVLDVCIYRAPEP